MDRVRCRKRNGSFCDKCKSHDKVCRSGFSFCFCKFIFKQKRCQSDRTRRNHTADHNCCHDSVISCCNGCRSKYIGRFVERTTHVNCHHTCYDDAKKNLTGTTHVCKSCVQCRVQCSDWRLYDKRHNKSHDQNAEYRIEKDWGNFFQCFRKFFEQFF